LPIDASAQKANFSLFAPLPTGPFYINYLNLNKYTLKANFGTDIAKILSQK